MAGLLNLGEMSALALHVMKRLAEAKNEGVSARMSAAEITAGLRASQHTVHKVVARLVNAGLLESARGPSGGLRLAAGAEKATLLSIIEAIDGTMESNDCLFARRVCPVDEPCVFSGLTGTLEKKIREYFTLTTVELLAKDVVSV